MAVVFDGYDDINPTNSVGHSRHNEGVVAPDIKIGNLQMKVLVKKNKFLGNANNKKKDYKVIKKEI